LTIVFPPKINGFWLLFVSVFWPLFCPPKINGFWLLFVSVFWPLFFPPKINGFWLLFWYIPTFLKNKEITIRKSEQYISYFPQDFVFITLWSYESEIWLNVIYYTFAMAHMTNDKYICIMIWRLSCFYYVFENTGQITL
jgi:hypothetical protein